MTCMMKFTQLPDKRLANQFCPRLLKQCVGGWEYNTSSSENYPIDYFRKSSHIDLRRGQPQYAKNTKNNLAFGILRRTCGTILNRLLANTPHTSTGPTNAKLVGNTNS